ncbi:hypothetical protein SOVF_097860 [Spinacia oleracea]|uniref:Small ribosomal subunit protein uS15c n=1 Tax=Spinacia oleracea TaxID=3562 RepID=A0A9R0K9T4_SPIOL|nr:uncharacterized protein LOC110801856 [Spinacia oleracea]KNA15488.1 hypothetical protein SOVF_097860 [Spinacia oleracea]
MASLALHLKPSQTLLRSNLTFSLLFSSSSSSSSDNNNNNSNNNNNGGDKTQPFSSYFADIKSKLKQHESPGLRQSNTGYFNPQSSSFPKKASIDEINRNLSDFRSRSTVPPKNLTRNVGNPNDNTEKKKLSIAAIRESLLKLKGGAGQGGGNTSANMSLNNYKNIFKNQPANLGSGYGGRGGGGGGRKVIGGSVENLPLSVFGREMKEKEMKKGEANVDDKSSEIQLYRIYSHEELGRKLRELRPEVTGKKTGGKEENWFSIMELNERLKKLKVNEDKSKLEGDAVFVELRKAIDSIKEKPKSLSFHGVGMFADPSSFMTSPPKEHLVEKYFHPDNMSAEEKLKIELKKMRDEFKMHESDCGSTRVQIAQLTTEILHLSSVLHKKDKHSRRGLLAKVQQRKKLLKYLRRTDWESYCFVLSKLGLRDNPDYKN